VALQENFHLPGRNGDDTIPPMGLWLRIALLLPLAALLGCGSSNSSSGSSGSTTQAPYNFNGGWGAAATGYPVDLPFDAVILGLQVSNGSVTGTIYPFSNQGSDPNPCSANNQDLAVTGTLDAAHDLTLTFSIAGGTGTLIATLADDPATYAYGTWEVTGGTCAVPSTGMVIYQDSPTTPPTTTSPAAITAPLSGDWGIGSDYTPPNYNFQYTYPKITGFGGSLQFANGAVSGTLFPDSAPIGGCGPLTAVAVTGTLDSGNNLILTVPLGGSYGTATITAILGSNPQTLADGSYQVTGGSCDLPATAMTIAQYAPITGTYTGTLSELSYDGTLIPGTGITMTAILAQSTTPNASGAFPITGSYTVSGTCTDSGTLPAITAQGGGLGTLSSSLSFSASANPTASNLNLYFSSTNCSLQYQGVLVRQ
jgi:hypothetical protein